MGDISAEPSMEEILSSIKRIIAEEGDAATGARSRRPARAAGSREPEAAVSAHADEVLELSDPVEERAADPVLPAAKTHSAAAPMADPILSERAVEATRGPLEALSRMVVRPETPGSDTLEGLVRSLLRPMLREWLDANLPQIVEAMVAREIARITSQR